ncbi:MAG: hypothetical protein NWF06_03800 [Candidatus Bathyarchaeota archaeon]|nr:hypothetical protein [Candidatus Bathyarchaeum sp.]
MNQLNNDFNTEVTCQRCGLPLDQCTCSPSQKKADRTIEIKHTYGNPEAVDDEVKRLRKELASKNSILELQATKELEKEVNKFDADLETFLNQVDDEDKKEELEGMFEYDRDDPYDLERVKDKLANAKIWSGLIKAGIEGQGGTVYSNDGGRRKYAGKARLQGNGNEPKRDAVADNYKQYIDGLYNVVKDPSTTVEQKEKANRTLDSLFGEVIRGLRVARNRTGYATGTYQIDECPNCGALNQGILGTDFEACPVCGWTLFSRDAKRSD